jgi:hypothetical protein
MDIIVTEVLTDKDDSELQIPVAIIIPVEMNFSIFRRSMVAPCGHVRCTVEATKEGLLPVFEMSMN